jgi:ankyrin repeat protein
MQRCTPIHASAAAAAVAAAEAAATSDDAQQQQQQQQQQPPPRRKRRPSVTWAAGTVSPPPSRSRLHKKARVLSGAQTEDSDSDGGEGWEGSDDGGSSDGGDDGGSSDSDTTEDEQHQQHGGSESSDVDLSDDERLQSQLSLLAEPGPVVQPAPADGTSLHPTPADGTGLIAARLALCARGDAAELRAHLRRHPELGVDTGNADSNPLQCAVWHGHRETTRVLLEHSADPNSQRSQNGATPLCIASHGGWADLLHLLIEAGGRLEQANANGATPVFIAAENGHTTVLRALIARGAAVNTPDQAGCSPAYISASRDVGGRAWSGCITQLARARADLNLRCIPANGGASPLHIAAARGRLGAFRALLENGADHTLETRRGLPLLGILARHTAQEQQPFLTALSLVEGAPRLAAAQRLAWVYAARLRVRVARCVRLYLCSMWWLVLARRGYSPLSHSAHAQGCNWVLAMLVGGRCVLFGGCFD